MDRPIDTGYRRTQRWKRAATALGGALCLGSLLVWLPAWVRPSIDRAQITLVRRQADLETVDCEQRDGHRTPRG